MPPSRDKSRQVMQAEIIGAFEIVTEAPVRTAHGLQWRVRCTADATHIRMMDHSTLAYGATPDCDQCREDERARKIAAKAEERRIVREAAVEMLAQSRDQRLAQQAQSEPDPVVAQQQEKGVVNA
jgi:hypothetical protein